MYFTFSMHSYFNMIQYNKKRIFSEMAEERLYSTSSLRRKALDGYYNPDAGSVIRYTVDSKDDEPTGVARKFLKHPRSEQYSPALFSSKKHISNIRQLCIKRWQLDESKRLGEGSFGYVNLVIDRHRSNEIEYLHKSFPGPGPKTIANEVYVVKVTDLDPNVDALQKLRRKGFREKDITRTQFHNETQILMKLTSDFIDKIEQKEKLEAISKQRSLQRSEKRELSELEESTIQIAPLCYQAFTCKKQNEALPGSNVHDTTSKHTGENGYIIMEKMDGDLYDLLLENNSILKRQVDEILVKSLQEMIEDKIIRLIASGVIHNDLHAGNILFRGSLTKPDEIEVFINDFGMTEESGVENTDEVSAADLHNCMEKINNFFTKINWKIDQRKREEAKQISESDAIACQDGKCVAVKSVKYSGGLNLIPLGPRKKSKSNSSDDSDKRQLKQLLLNQKQRVDEFQNQVAGMLYKPQNLRVNIHTDRESEVSTTDRLIQADIEKRKLRRNRL